VVALGEKVKVKANMKKCCETKEKLLQVGFDLFWDSSYGSVSVDDICKRAGINKGSFYHFFPSKADLLVEAYEEHWKEKRPIMDRMFSPCVPPVERLQNWCRFIYEAQKEKAEQYGHVCGCPYASVGCEIATMDEKIRIKSEQLMNAGMKYVETALADAIRQNAVTIKDPIAAAKTLQTVVIGKMVEAKVQNDIRVLADLEALVMDFIGAKNVPA
jgi:TetR/AcrR family transcriptional repressor of nem operon